jgi:hypothetical protein
MRGKSIAVFSAVLIIALMFPAGAMAKRVTGGGSLTITKASGALTTELVVTAVLTNPGLEKTVAQQLPLPGPLYVLPFFVNQDKSNPQQGDLDTILLLTNTTGSSLSIILTLRALDGTVLAVSPQTLSANQTLVLFISDLLP